ncbi:hypothetical protein M758_UG199000, partial [Ceratodon purpureus]
ICRRTYVSLLSAPRCSDYANPQKPTSFSLALSVPVAPEATLVKHNTIIRLLVRKAHRLVAHLTPGPRETPKRLANSSQSKQPPQNSNSPVH